MTYAIEACQLTQFYGRRPAIENVSFALQTGEVTGFLGPNAAGKSTTIRILTGLLQATSGRAYICGQSVTESRQKIYKHLGYLPEHNPLPLDLTVEGYLNHRARLKGVHPRHVRSKVHHALEKTNLNNHRNRWIGTLSKGSRQRVGIAEALLHEPKVLILDEPTVGLDPQQLVKFREWMDSLRGHMTVLISSHLLSEIEALCDHLIIIHQGHIIATGTPPSLRETFVKTLDIQLDFLSAPEGIEAKLEAILQGIPFQIKGLNPITVSIDVKNTPENAHLPSIQNTLLKALMEAYPDHLVGLKAIEPTLEDIFLSATQF
jgi:ABC-2 type transport system ATP-binding protein